MLLSRGTKVKLKHSNEEGLVMSLLDNGMVKVLLKDTGMEIPVFPDALIPLYDSSNTKAKVVPGKQVKAETTPPPPPIDSQYTILKSKGIQLAFDPVFQSSDVPEKYLVYLLNDTNMDILYGIQFKLAGEEIFKKHGKLNSMQYLQLGTLYYDELNDAPSVVADCRRITTDGTGAKHDKALKIKPKQFFKNIQTAPLLNRKVHLFVLFDRLKASRKDPSVSDLKKYTQQNSLPIVNKKPVVGDLVQHEVKDRAEFQAEIDLHIESLTSDSSKLNKAEILHYQIKAFEEYIDKALRVGVDRVFIIHGVGEGKLRNAIATRLIKQPFVKTFKNEYHPKYGYGATEVIFD